MGGVILLGELIPWKELTPCMERVDPMDGFDRMERVDPMGGVVPVMGVDTVGVLIPREKLCPWMSVLWEDIISSGDLFP